MDKYPEYVSGTGRPLVFLLGSVDNEPDIHGRLIKLFETVHTDIGTNEISPLHFKSVPVEYPFTEKKPPKENLSTEGLLKFSWPLKHYEQIPSVVLYCVPFGVDWTAAEWAKRELAIQERYSKLKAALSSREVKVVMLMFKVGVGSLEREVLDERLSSFKRHAQTDSKSLIFFNLHELVAENTTIRRLYKTIREGSFTYYASNIKRFKQIEKSVADRCKTPSEQQLLLARYAFKIAFFNEFQGQMNYSLRFYRQSYGHLAAALELLADEELHDQVKAVAEIAHFKTCRLLLLQKSVDEACQQFRQHVLLFAKLYSRVPWRHSQWVADQFLVFCQLLDRFSVPDSLPYADRSFYYQNAARFTLDRARNFQRSRKNVSARFDASDEVQTLQQQQGQQTDSAASASASASSVAQNLGSGSGSSTGRWRVKAYRGRLFCAPRFVGAAPQILVADPASVGDASASNTTSNTTSLVTEEEELSSLFFDFLFAQETRVNHHKLVSELLVKALSSLPALSSAAGGSAVTTLGANQRRKALLLYQMATQHQQLEQQQQANEQGFEQGYEREAALAQLWTAVSPLQRDRWHVAAMPLLLAVTQEAVALGRARDFLEAALALYANVAYVYFSRHDLEELHLHVMCLLHHSLLGDEGLTLRQGRGGAQGGAEQEKEEAVSLAQLPYVHNAASFLTSTYLPLLRRDSYGLYRRPSSASTSSSSASTSTSTSNTTSNTTSTTTSASTSERLLPNGHTLHLDRDCRMVEVDCHFARPAVELGEELRLSVTVKSLFLDALCFDELALVSFDDAVTRVFRHRDTPTAAGDTPTGDTRDTAGDTDTLDLRLQPFQPLRFTCVWQVTEAVFARFLAKDAVFGLDRVELRWRSSRPRHTATQSQREETQREEERSLTLRVSACPAEVAELRRSQQPQQQQTTQQSTMPLTQQTQQQSQQQTWSLRDAYSFARLQPLHRPLVCRVSRPAQLLRLLSPLDNNHNYSDVNASSNTTGVVEVLQGLVQRVDVLLEVGRHDLAAAKVFLSSDITPSSSNASNASNNNNNGSGSNGEEAATTTTTTHDHNDNGHDAEVFYLPDMAALLRLGRHRKHRPRPKDRPRHTQTQNNNTPRDTQKPRNTQTPTETDTQTQTNPEDEGEEEVLEEEEEEQVCFRAMRLNGASQPRLPLLLEGALVAGSRVLVPLFLRVSEAVAPGKYTLALAVEAVPRDVMASAAVLDFRVSVTVRRALTATHQLRLCAPDNCALSPVPVPSTSASTSNSTTSTSGTTSSGTTEVWRVAAGAPLTLETSLRCLHTLRRDAPLLVRHLRHLPSSTAASTTGIGGGCSVSVACPTDDNTAASSAAVAQSLRSQETLRRSLLLRPNNNSNNSSNCGISDNNSNNNNTAAATASSQEEAQEASLGRYVVQWRDASCRPLATPRLLSDTDTNNDGVGVGGAIARDTGFFPASHRFHWLLFAHPRPLCSVPLLPPSSSNDIDTDADAEADRDVEELLARVWGEVVRTDGPGLRAAAETQLLLPKLQVAPRRFVVRLLRPAQCRQSESFLLRLFVRCPRQSQSQQSQQQTQIQQPRSRAVERLKVLVWLHEDFLVGGSTSSVVDLLEDEHDDDDDTDAADAADAIVVDEEGHQQQPHQRRGSSSSRRRDGEEVLTLRCVPLRPGWLSLPRIQLLWEKRPSANSNGNGTSGNGASGNGANGGAVETVFDLGERDDSRPRVFVTPSSNNNNTSNSNSNSSQ